MLREGVWPTALGLSKASGHYDKPRRSRSKSW
jgi:hypothetical protein